MVAYEDTVRALLLRILLVPPLPKCEVVPTTEFEINSPFIKQPNHHPFQWILFCKLKIRFHRAGLLAGLNKVDGEVWDPVSAERGLQAVQAGEQQQQAQAAIQQYSIETHGFLKYDIPQLLKNKEKRHSVNYFYKIFGS